VVGAVERGEGEYGGSLAGGVYGPWEKHQVKMRAGSVTDRAVGVLVLALSLAPSYAPH